VKIAVTGVGGFIGKHVLAELRRRPVQVYVPNRACLDVRDPPDDAFDLLGRPDVLIHLAWGGLPDYKSLHHFEIELPAHYEFLGNMIRAGLKNLVVAGTCFEFGNQSGPLGEDTETRPDNPYGFAKDALRRQLQFLQKIESFNLTWARFFYLYGEGQGENSLLSQLKRAVERGDKEFNMSGGEQLRDYLPVTEAVWHLVSLAVMQRDIGIVNICSGRPTSVRSLVEGWIEKYDWPITLNLGHYPYSDYEPMAFWGKENWLNAGENDEYFNLS